MNKVILIGNITRDLELRKTQTNKSVVNFSLAINDGYGENKRTDYIDVVAWEKLADTIADYCSKGKKIMVDGKLRVENYEKNGEKKKNVYVLANEVEFLFPRETENKPDPVMEQTTLNDGSRDILGRNVTIETDDLPFY